MLLNRTPGTGVSGDAACQSLGDTQGFLPSNPMPVYNWVMNRVLSPDNRQRGSQPVTLQPTPGTARPDGAWLVPEQHQATERDQAPWACSPTPWRPWPKPKQPGSSERSGQGEAYSESPTQLHVPEAWPSAGSDRAARHPQPVPTRPQTS